MVAASGCAVGVWLPQRSARLSIQEDVFKVIRIKKLASIEFERLILILTGATTPYFKQVSKVSLLSPYQ